MRVERGAVLVAATRVLAASPGASTSDIAAAASISRATLHRLFPSRDAIVQAIDALATERVSALLASSSITHAPALEALQHLTRAIVPLVHEFAFLVRQAQVETGRSSLDKEQGIYAPLLRLLRRGQAEGVLRPELPPTWLLHAYSGLLYAVASASLRGDIAPRDAAHLVVSTFLCGAAEAGFRGNPDSGNLSH
jgi:AcrR family transcriptional regulator